VTKGQLVEVVRVQGLILSVIPAKPA
jgi:hypothetical protein